MGKDLLSGSGLSTTTTTTNLISTMDIMDTSSPNNTTLNSTPPLPTAPLPPISQLVPPIAVPMTPAQVLILDAGAQYAKLIDRSLRELNVHSEIWPLALATAEAVQRSGAKALVISGGPNSVYSADALTYDAGIFSLGLPVLGICYGFQLLNARFGGSVQRKEIREDGQYTVTQADGPSSPLFSGIPAQFTALLTHGDSIEVPAPGFSIIATSGSLIAGIANEKDKLYGVQFHPEVDLTPHGNQIFANFLFGISKLVADYTLQSREVSCIAEIKRAVGDGKVLMLLSGGVDSTVCAALLKKALRPDQILAVHIDNGFLRKNESDDVEESLRRLGLSIKVIHASHLFSVGTTNLPIDPEDPDKSMPSKQLCFVTDPEEKRKIIGDVFMRVANQVIESLNLNPSEVILGQGTLRPDLIESASHLASMGGSADTIKTHHNDSGLVRKLREEGRVVEPLKDFHKDEVRQLGRDLGLPEDLIDRHPFPGPGLAIRVLCALEPFQEADFGETQVLLKLIVEYSSMLEKNHALLNRVEGVCSVEERDMLRKISRIGTGAGGGHLRSFLLPIRSVGVQGDRRSYSYVAALTSDGPPDWNDLFYLARIIPKICHSVNRVCYVFGPQLKDTVSEITPTLLTPAVLTTLRQADHVVHQALTKFGHKGTVSQLPVVLIPIHFDRTPFSKSPPCQRSIVLRPFITRDFMTGVPAVPGKDLPIEVVQTMVDEASCVHGISRVLYDLTTKPPGTTEWE